MTKEYFTSQESFDSADDESGPQNPTQTKTTKPMSTEEQEDDNAVLTRLVGMKDEWLQIEAEIRSKASALQADLAQKRKEKDAISQQHTSLQTQYFALQAQFTALETALTQERKDKADLAQQNATLRDELVQERVEKEKLSRQLEIIAAGSKENGKGEDKGESEDINKLKQEHVHVMQKLEADFLDRSRANEDAANIILGLKEENEKLKIRLEEADNKLNILNAHVTELEQLKATINNNKMEPANKKLIDEHQEEVKLLRDEIARLREADRKREEDEAKAGVKPVGYEANLKELQSELQEKAAEVERNSKLVKTLEEQVKDFKEKIQILEDECDILRSQSDALKDELNIRQDSNDELKSAMNNDADIKAMGESIQLLSDEVHKLKAENKGLSDRALVPLSNEENSPPNSNQQLNDEVNSLQDKLATALATEKELRAQVQQLQQQSVSQLLQEQNLKQQLGEANRSRRDSNGEHPTGDRSPKDLNSTGSTSSIQDEAHLLALQNKIYHLSRSLEEAQSLLKQKEEDGTNASIEQLQLYRSNIEELNAVLHEREKHIAEMEMEVQELRMKEAELKGTQQQSKIASPQSKVGSPGRTESPQDLPSDMLALRRRVVELTSQLAKKERSITQDDASRRRVLELEEEVSSLHAHVSELTNELQHAEGYERGMEDEQSSEVRKMERPSTAQQGDVVDRTVHEAALEMMRVIQREHSLEAERVGREFGEEKFRHQETARKLQEAQAAIIILRKKLKGLTGSDHFDESEDAVDREVSEMQRLRDAVTVALGQVDEERKSLAREREAHALTHSLLREERTRAIKEKDLLEEQLTVTRKNLAEVVEEVLVAEELAAEKERQLVAAIQRIRDLEERIGSPDSMRRSFPAPVFPATSANNSVMPPASKIGFSSPPSPPVPRHFSASDLPIPTQPSTHIPQMRTARLPGETFTLSQSVNPSYFSDSSNQPFPSPISYSPTPPPLTLSQIRTPFPSPAQPSLFAPPHSLSQPYSSQHISSPQSSRQPLPPRPSSSASTRSTPQHPAPFPTTSHQYKNNLHTPAPSVSRLDGPANSHSVKSDPKTNGKGDDTQKDELVALLARTSQTIASKSTEMENIRKQLQATEQRLRTLQRDKEEMDALRDGIDAFGKSFGNL